MDFGKNLTAEGQAMQASKGQHGQAVDRGLDTVTTTDVAKALGISGTAVRKRAAKQSWPTTGNRVRGGGRVYPLGSLPLTAIDRRKVSRHLVEKALKQANPIALPALLQVEDNEDLDQLRAAIGRALPTIGKDGLIALLHTAAALMPLKTDPSGVPA